MALWPLVNVVRCARGSISELPLSVADLGSFPNFLRVHQATAVLTRSSSLRHEVCYPRARRRRPGACCRVWHPHDPPGGRRSRVQQLHAHGHLHERHRRVLVQYRHHQVADGPRRCHAGLERPQVGRQRCVLRHHHLWHEEMVGASSPPHGYQADCQRYGNSGWPGRLVLEAGHVHHSPRVLPHEQGHLVHGQGLHHQELALPHLQHSELAVHDHQRPHAGLERWRRHGQEHGRLRPEQEHGRHDLGQQDLQPGRLSRYAVQYQHRLLQQHMQRWSRYLHRLHRRVVGQLVRYRVGSHGQEQQDHRQCERYPYQDHYRSDGQGDGRDVHGQHAVERRERYCDPRRLQQVQRRLHRHGQQQGLHHGHHDRWPHGIGGPGVRHPGELQVRFGLELLGY